MSPPSKGPYQNQFPNVGSLLRRGDVAFALGMVSILIFLLLPMPRFMLDICLAFSITFSILIFMVSLFIERPLDFSSFPTILLIATMLRLSLNVASTRLILTNGHEGVDAAGEVIKAFGNFLMGGNFVIGIIIFCILLIINFIVITKGSGRIAEVSARFSLDSLPGKQMAIDADLSAGLISETDARERRKNLELESNFFGAMDGSAKFVRGDAIAGVMITVINIIGGIIIGVTNKMSLSDAAHTYTLLTVGDGLVTQVPALMVSVAAGMLVSKTGTDGSTDKALISQLSAHPVALGLCSFIMIVLGFLPGVPKIPFFLLAFLTGAGAWYLSMQMEGAKQEALETMKEVDKKEVSEGDKLQEVLRVDPVRLELGYATLALTNPSEGESLPDQIRIFRQQIASEMGMIIPAVHIQDNLSLPQKEYAIFIKDVEAGRGSLNPDQLLVMNPSGDTISMEGEKTKDPTFGIDAMWIRKDLKTDAEEKGYTVVDASTVLITHFSEIIKEYLSDLLSYQDTQDLLQTLERTQAKLVKDLIPEHITTAQVHRILQNLLKENVAIRDLPTILEGIAEIIHKTTNLSYITEHVRSRLGRQICHEYLNEEGLLPVIHMSSKWQQAFQDSLIREGEQIQLAMSPTDLQTFIESIKTSFDLAPTTHENPVLLTPATIRPFVRSIIERFRPSIPVLSQNEIHPKIRIKTIGEVRDS